MEDFAAGYGLDRPLLTTITEPTLIAAVAEIEEPGAAPTVAAAA